MNPDPNHLPRVSERRKHGAAGLTRRGFLKKTAQSAAFLGFPSIIPATALGEDGKAAPSGRVRVALIACGNRSKFALGYSRLANAEIAACADPSDRAIDSLLEQAKPANAWRRTRDFREILEDGSIDAVHISTADHWHVPIMLMAARAGKHVYVEKPLGLSIGQDLACREILGELPVKVQYGTQQRSTIYARSGVELVLNGHIGEVKEAYIWALSGVSGGVCEATEPPADLDYDLWLGPAPVAPYCRERCEIKGNNNAIFHVYDYAIGFVAGWGAHPYDTFQWWADHSGLAMPATVEAKGSLPTSGLRNTATNWDATLTYSNGFKAHFFDDKTAPGRLPKLEGFNPSYNGVLFVGSEGWLCTGRAGWEASSREILLRSKDPGPERLVTSNNHLANFIDAIQGKSEIVSPLASGIRSDICCHLTDLAIRHGGQLGWDGAKNTITGNDAAKAAIHREMRKPWAVLNPKYT